MPKTFKLTGHLRTYWYLILRVLVAVTGSASSPWTCQSNNLFWTLLSRGELANAVTSRTQKFSNKNTPKLQSFISESMQLTKQAGIPLFTSSQTSV